MKFRFVFFLPERKIAQRLETIMFKGGFFVLLPSPKYYGGFTSNFIWNTLSTPGFLSAIKNKHLIVFMLYISIYSS